MKHLLALSMLCALLATVVHASDIYKYTAPDGTVHYVDRPTGSPTEQRVSIVSSRTNTAAVQARMQSFADSRARAGEANADREAARQAAEEARAEQERRARDCSMYRDRLETYLQSRRLYREDENGERVYLDEKETLEARRQVEEKIAETCDG